MREFEYTIDRALMNGLAPEESMPTGSEVLEECVGFRCGRLGLEGYRLFSNPLPGTIEMFYSWPFPQVLTGERYNFLIVRDATINMQDTVYSISDDAQTITKIFDVDQLTFGQGMLMEAADFGEYAYLTNGVIMIYWDTSLNIWRKVIADSKIPMMRTVCNFNGQMIGGCVLSDWHNCDEKFYTWSKIGEADFTLDNKNTAGYKRDLYGGEVYHVRAMEKFVVGYSSKGIIAMTPIAEPVPSFGFNRLLDIGLLNRGAENGNEFMRVFIGEDYILRRITNQGVEELGYQWLLEELVGDVIVSYDPALKDFYISSSTVTYLLSEKGLTEVPQHPSALWRRNKETYGLPDVVGDYYPMLKTWPIDFGYAGLKTNFTIEAGVSGISGMYAAVGYLDDNQVWHNTNYFSANGQNSATVIVSGNQFKYTVRFDEADYGARVSRITARYKMTDMRAIRGVYAPPPRGQ